MIIRGSLEQPIEGLQDYTRVRVRVRMRVWLTILKVRVRVSDKEGVEFDVFTWVLKKHETMQNTR